MTTMSALIERGAQLESELAKVLEQIEALKVKRRLAAGKPLLKCSVCGVTNSSVRWVGGYIPHLCDSSGCTPF